MAEILTDLPEEPDLFKQKDSMSFEEAIDAQMQELEQEQQPPAEAGQPDEGPEEEVAIEEGPSSEDKPEVVEPIDDQAPDAVEEEVPEHFFEVDGQPITLEEAKNGYLRHDKFTQRMQEIAAERKQYEELAQQVAAEREQYVTGLARARALDEALYTEPDWATLRQQDPEGYVGAREAWDQIQTRRQAFDQEIQQALEAQKRENEARMANYYAAEQERLLEQVPEWREKAAVEEFHKGVVGYLQQYGYSPEEIDKIGDHRLLLVLRDAMQGQAATGAAPIVQKKVAKARKGLGGAPRQAAPTRNTSRLAQAKERFNSPNASFDDAIAMQMAEQGLDYTDEMK